MSLKKTMCSAGCLPGYSIILLSDQVLFLKAVRYQNKYRLIEPYSLRRTEEGNILLYALRHESKDWRSYRVDRIQGAEITQTSFVPMHAIELTAANHLPVPRL